MCRTYHSHLRELKTEIKLTESLAAPLIESIRRQYEQRIAEKNAEVAKHELSLREREEALSKARESLEDQVAEKVRAERAKIVAEETKKARLALSTDLEQKTKDIADLQELLVVRQKSFSAWSHY